MALPAPIDLKEWFGRSVEDYLCIAPTSTSPQPVHVLNGFFHNALTGRRSARAAIDSVATQNGRWARSGDQLRTRALNLPTDDYDLARVRRAVSGLVAADRAVYIGNASFQLAHLGLVTSDSTHFRLGLLAAKLALGPGQARGELETLVALLATPQPNPHWAIQAVLSEPDVLRDVEIADEQRDGSWIYDERCSSLAHELGSLLRRILASATGSVDSLLLLQTLGSAATWCGLIAFAQVPALLVNGQLTPLLCEAGSPGEMPTLRASSAGALHVVNSTFEELLRLRLRAELEDRFGVAEPSESDAKEYLIECEPYALSGGSQRTHERLPALFDLWHRDGRGVKDAMAHALQDDLLAGMGDKPRKWFSAVGRHCGFVGPRRGYPARFRAEVALIPALVLGGVADSDGEAIPFSTWLARMGDRFGVYFGPDAACRSMLPRAGEQELERNAADLATLLSSLGLARRYSDGVTEILNPLFLWRN